MGIKMRNVEVPYRKEARIDEYTSMFNPIEHPGISLAEKQVYRFFRPAHRLV